MLQVETCLVAFGVNQVPNETSLYYPGYLSSHHSMQHLETLMSQNR